VDRPERSARKVFQSLVLRILDFENLPVDAADLDAPGPDLVNRHAWITVSAQNLTKAGFNLAAARSHAREAGDLRPVVVVNRYEPQVGPVDALAVMSLHDLAVLLGRAADAEEVAA
jgi:endonuclease V-like protein UPF0215 family